MQTAYTANNSRCSGAVRASPARSRQMPSRFVRPRVNAAASASRSRCSAISAARYPPVSAMRTTIAVRHSALLHGYTVLATDTTLPGVSSTSPACTRHPRRTMRVGPRWGADQHTGHRGVGGVVGAKAAGRRIGARSDMPTIYRAPRHMPLEVDGACQARQRAADGPGATAMQPAQTARGTERDMRIEKPRRARLGIATN
jgi:hypothetical protein